MKENHTFEYVDEDTLDEVCYRLECLAKENPYGVVCAPIVVDRTGKEIARIGVSVDVGDKGVNLSQWKRELENDVTFINFFR